MELVKTLTVTAFTCLFFHNSCFALTGAELLQSNKDFARGYVFGVVEGYVLVLEQDAKAEQRRQKVHDCLGKSSVSAETIFGAVANHIERNPKELAEPSIGAIYRTLNEICPAQ